MLIKYHGTDFLEDLDRHICSFVEVTRLGNANTTQWFLIHWCKQAVGVPATEQQNKYSIPSQQKCKQQLKSEHFETTIDVEKERMTIKFKDSFHRFLAHSVCRYYSLTSNSKLKPFILITLVHQTPNHTMISSFRWNEVRRQTVDNRLCTKKFSPTLDDAHAYTWRVLDSLFQSVLVDLCHCLIVLFPSDI